jgi:hypothetical protein
VQVISPFADDPLDADQRFYDTLAHKMGGRIFLILAIGFGIVVPMVFVLFGLWHVMG